MCPALAAFSEPEAGLLTTPPREVPAHARVAKH